MEGNIVVDGVLASCYAGFDHDAEHFGMAPLRWFPEMTEWMFGEDKGFHVYVQTLMEILSWILPHEIFL